MLERVRLHARVLHTSITKKPNKYEEFNTCSGLISYLCSSLIQDLFIS